MKLQEVLDAGRRGRENSMITTKKRRNNHVNLLKGLIMTMLYEDDHEHKYCILMDYCNNEIKVED